MSTVAEQSKQSQQEKRVVKQQTFLLPDGKWKTAEIIFWLLPIPAYFLFPQYQVLMGQIMILGLFALSLDLILGYAGIVSLGHAAFFGLGAYTAGLLSVHGWGEPVSALFAAAAVGAIAGYISSFLVVRGNDLARLMVTMGIGLMLYEVANKAVPITGGIDGLYGMEMWKLLGLFEFDLNGRTAFFYSLVVLFLSFVAIRRIVHSPFGLGLQGIREGGKRMPAIGANVKSRLVVVYTISAAFAAIAGALLAQTTQYVSIDVVGFQRSADLMIVLILGGTGRLYGGLVGAVVFMVAHHLLSDMNPAYWQFWLGLLLVVIIMWASKGILGGTDSILAYVRKKMGSKGAQA